MSALLCAICRESLEVGTLNKSCALPCGHVFHDHCIFNWLERSQTCPHCRVESRPEQVIKLYFDLSEDSVNLDPNKEIEQLKSSLDKLQTQYKEKAEDAKIFHRQLNSAIKSNEMLRKKTGILTFKLNKLKAIKYEFESQKNTLKMSIRALERERARNAHLLKESYQYQRIKTLLDGSVEDACNLINSNECVDFDTLKVCFATMKRDFKNLAHSEAKLKHDYSSLFSMYKAMENAHTAMIEKCSVQDTVIESYRNHLNNLPNLSIGAMPSFDSRMDEEKTNYNLPSMKPIPRRSPRNIVKRTAMTVEQKISTNRQLCYDGLGGHSAGDVFPSAKLKPCRIVSNRRK